MIAVSWPRQHERQTPRRFFILLIVVLVQALASQAEASEEALWQALRQEGHAALLRHAIAPGTGDPVNFSLDDCLTQRNLSEEGRHQAARIGARFMDNGIDRADLYSSQWCRCLDTANLLDLGSVQELPILNSFFERHERRAEQTQALRTWLSEATLKIATVLVTHQVNISALTGVYPSSGELVVIRMTEEGDVLVVGTIETD